MRQSAKRKAKQKKKDSQLSKYEFLKRPPRSWLGFLFRNLLIGLFFFLLFSKIYNSPKFRGYPWLWNNFIVANWKVMEEHPDFTFEQKQQMKMGYFAAYLQYINKNTPDSAVILMPTPDIVNEIGEKDKKRDIKWLRSKRHTTYMIYPRKAVYENSPRDSIYLDKITHVAIVGGQRYDKLPYRIKNRPAYTVLPLNPDDLK
ncbi:hypothetical protein [uncultured Draconibacterium sp.]|uniref:hypothetical protein n=1 Tax=uncultured Draconibacterium sp. TaxID=1573823 RepID=UPI0025D04FAF|nr:hypothetical protein [uncultured Draconibacterium sp.]